MRDDPSGADLLDVARRTLVDDIAPGLQGEARYKALMIANAMGIVGREIAAVERQAKAWDVALAHAATSAAKGDGGNPRPSTAGLVASIRAGAHDADPALYRALMETTDIAAAIWKPARGAASASGT